MPELPEVEVVRAGLDHLIRDHTITEVRIHHERAIRRHLAGAADLTRLIVGSRIAAVRRRGKYLWFPLSSGAALLAHLGMSGQLLVGSSNGPDPGPDNPHLRVSIALADPAGGDHTSLSFADQRTFGAMWADPPSELSGHTTGPARQAIAGRPAPGWVGHAPQPSHARPSDAPTKLPASIRHVAPDPLEAAFDEAAFATALRAKRTEIKRAILDQRLVSGIGNIYADEALWRARVHYRQPTKDMPIAMIDALVTAVRDVFADAIAAGGTSFDSLYVNVNGRSGYFDRKLRAYGQAGRECQRCGGTIVREAFTNRSSYYCPRCQVVNG